MSWLALDIGGANLKVADGLGWARGVPFALWNEPDCLAAAIADLMASAPACTRVAVTMTGELCDCFRTKVEGVRHILMAVENAAAGRNVLVYLVDGQILSLDAARERTLLAAASNWHALARFACRFVDDKAALLIDVGSTTTDIIPLVDRQVAARGMIDTARLLTGELVYAGVGRTPVCAVVDRLPYRGEECPVAAELFATTADAYVILGEMAEQAEASWTADGRHLTRPFARERLARMICADGTTFDDSDARLAAEAIQDVQLLRLGGAVDQVASTMSVRPQCFIVSGAGEFLAARLVSEKWGQVKVISLAVELGAVVSACAPAHALAVLARETRG